MTPMHWIRQGRKERGLSQANLARVTGIVQAHISMWELDKAEPSEPGRQRILEVFRQLDAGRIPDGLLLRNHRKSASAAKEFGDGGENAEAEQRSKQWFPPVEFAQGETDIRREPTVVACFAGCGGMGLGFRQAGFSVLGYVELNDAARRTFARNFPEATPLACDVRDVQDHHARNWRHRFGHVDVLCGGPPCQGFSLAGKRDQNDSRNTLFRDYLRIAEHLAPAVVVMENVRVLTSMKDPDGRPVLNRIRDEFDRIGYDVEHRELNAQDFGVPQFRERVFFVAVRRDLAPKRPLFFPQPTHGHEPAPSLFSPGLKPYSTFRDATSDLEPLESGQASKSDLHHWAVDHPPHVLRWLRDVPEGRSAHDNRDPDLRPPSGYNTTYKRLRWDEPSSTIGTTFGMISACRTVHPKCTRSLTVREAIRCQTFPDEYVFEGTTGDIRTQIGNAVPPGLSRAIATHIGAAIAPAATRRRAAS